MSKNVPRKYYKWDFRFKNPHWGTFEEEIHGEQRDRYVARGSIWVYLIMEMLDGEILYHDGKDLIRITEKKYGLFLPSWSLTFRSYQNTSYKVKGCWSDIPFPETANHEKFSKPMLFIPTNWDLPNTRQELIHLIDSTSLILNIDRAQYANTLTLKSKKIIDSSYTTNIKVNDIAAQMKLSSSRISSNFGRDLGINIVDYRNLTRSLASVYFISQGHAVADVAKRVGFQSLSRFNRSTKRNLALAPHKMK